MVMFNSLIIDDESLAREELKALLNDYPEIIVVGEANNAIEGIKQIHKLKPDVVFVDIQMPQITGIDMLSMLDSEKLPYIIFVTAYDQYAVQAFEDNAFDYLLKPINEERLKKTILKLVKTGLPTQNLTTMMTKTLAQIPCTGLNRILFIPTESVEVAFSDISGVHLKTDEQCGTSQLTLKQLEEKTPLIRCHRQYLINPKTIQELKLLENGLAEIRTLHNHKVPVSRRYLKPLKEALGVIS